MEIHGLRERGGRGERHFQRPDDTAPGAGRRRPGDSACGVRGAYPPALLRKGIPEGDRPVQPEHFEIRCGGSGHVCGRKVCAVLRRERSPALRHGCCRGGAGLRRASSAAEGAACGRPCAQGGREK